MAIRDYWVYQERQVSIPWALYIVKEYDKRYPKETTCLDFTIYHENINNPTHSQSFINLACETVSDYVSEIAYKISDLTTMAFTTDDKKQLEKVIFNILTD